MGPRVEVCTIRCIIEGWLVGLAIASNCWGVQINIAIENRIALICNCKLRRHDLLSSWRRTKGWLHGSSWVVDLRKSYGVVTGRRVCKLQDRADRRRLRGCSSSLRSSHGCRSGRWRLSGSDLSRTLSYRNRTTSGQGKAAPGNSVNRFFFTLITSSNDLRSVRPQSYKRDVAP